MKSEIESKEVSGWVRGSRSRYRRVHISGHVEVEIGYCTRRVEMFGGAD